MSSKRKYYIEFVGAHGAGKTSIFHAIALQEMLLPHVAIYPGQVKRPKLHFALSVAALTLKNISHLYFVVMFILKKSKFKWVNYRNVLRPLLKMVILHPYYRRFDFDVWLKDDMLHLIPRIIFKDSVDAEDALREYFEHFSYLYDGLIYVDIDSETVQERFKTRFPGRSAKFKKSREVIHERAFEQNKILRRIVTQQSQVPHLVLDGSEDIQENAERAVTFIKEKVLAT